MMHVSQNEELGAMCAWLLAAACIAFAVHHGVRKAAKLRPVVKWEREEEGVNGIEGWKVCPHNHWHHTTSEVCAVDGARLTGATGTQLARLKQIVEHPDCNARFQEDIFLHAFARFLIGYEIQEGRQLDMAFAIELYQSGGLLLLKSEQGRLI